MRRNPVPVYYEQGVVGDRVHLPCDISIAEGPHQAEDSVVLVLWYREDLGTPIYSIDTREREYKHAERWSDDRVFGPRAYFILEKHPAQLSVDNVRDADEGTYRCRVDFKFAQTRNSKVVLTVIVPPQKIIITDESGKIKKSVVGPYTEGASLTLTCTVLGAKPGPLVQWLRKDQVVSNKTFSSSTETASLQISLAKLGRSDLLTELTCLATNNNRTNLSATVQIDMNFSPLDVRILEPKQPFTAGRKYELICQSIGSRPPAKVTWWIGGHRSDRTKDTTSTDGNTTTSVLQFIPHKMDSGKYLSCRAENQFVSKEALESGWELKINYIPEARIVLGASLRPDGIKEGADVYFDCIVDALPPSFKVDWKLNGQRLFHHVGHGVIISNQSLVLQRVNRNSAGDYTCKAYNTEGEGESNKFSLNILYAPTCKPNQTRIYGVAKLEKVNITCEVEANPADVVFKWSFNNSQESVDVLPNHITKSGTSSIVSHVPATDMDYGTLLCSASNKVGQQRTPCMYHIVAAGKPDRVSNCSVWNITMTSFSLKCIEGYNGGMLQTFHLEVVTETDLKANITSPVPRFQIVGLQAGTRYMAVVYSTNLKGRSEPTYLDVTTLGNSERILNLKEAEKPVEKFYLSTTISVVIGVVLSLIVLACLVATALQVHCSRIENQQNKDKLRNEVNVYSSNDSVSSSEKNCDGYFADKMFLNHNNTVMTEGEEKEPDVIPQPIGDINDHKDYIHRKQHISTIEAEIPVMQNLFSSSTPLRNYTSYCTLRNGTMPLQNFSHLNKINVISPKDHQFGVSTLPKKINSSCVPSTSDGYRYPNTYRAHTPLSCTIPEEEPSPSTTPLISPKQESAV